MKKVLLAITTFNQSEYTRACLESLQSITDEHGVIVIDDASTDDTVDLCKKLNVKCIAKTNGQGLTDSWNKAYHYFMAKKNEYEYLAIANNDILIPNGALNEMKAVLEKWPCSLVVPMSTKLGSGHNRSQIIDNWYGQNNYENPEHYNKVQQYLLDLKQEEMKSNNLYKFDPIRMKMFNGFFFMMNKNICQYERNDGHLFDPEFINVKNEDEFNWGNLIPNDDFAMLCKTAFIFHFKGVSFTKSGLKYSNNLKEHLKQREDKFNTTK